MRIVIERNRAETVVGTPTIGAPETAETAVTAVIAVTAIVEAAAVAGIIVTAAAAAEITVIGRQVETIVATMTVDTVVDKVRWCFLCICMCVNAGIIGLIGWPHILMFSLVFVLVGCVLRISGSFHRCAYFLVELIAMSPSSRSSRPMIFVAIHIYLSFATKNNK